MSAIGDLAAGPHTPEAVDAWMAGKSFPIVEGNSISFIWRGDAEAGGDDNRAWCALFHRRN